MSAWDLAREMETGELWFVSDKKEDCPLCKSLQTVSIEYYKATRSASPASNEFVTINFVQKKTLKKCSLCQFQDESWEEWKENIYTKGYESDFLKRRALYFMKNVPSMVEEGLEDYFKIRPYDIELRLEYASLLYEKRKLGEAYKQLKEILGKKTTFIPILDLLAKVLFDLYISKNEVWYDKRIYYKKFVRLFSNFRDLQKELNNTLRILLEQEKDPIKRLHYYYMAGLVVQDLFQLDLAESYFSFIVKESQEPWLIADSYIQLALIFSAKGDSHKTLEFLDKSYGVTPNALVFYHRAKMYRKEKDLPNFRKEISSYLDRLEELIRREPKNPKFAYLKGIGLELISEDSVLVSYYEEIVKNYTIDLEYRKVFYERIQFLGSRDKAEKSIAMLETCPVCQNTPIESTKYPESVAGLDNWPDGINSTVFYLQETVKNCPSCFF